MKQKIKHNKGMDAVALDTCKTIEFNVLRYQDFNAQTLSNKLDRYVIRNS